MIIVSVVKFRNMKEAVPTSVSCPKCFKKVFLTYHDYITCSCKESGTLNLATFAEHLMVSKQRRFFYHRNGD